MMHPYTPTRLSEEPKCRATSSKEIRCKVRVRRYEAWEKTGKLGNLGQPSLWHGNEPRGVEVRGESSASAETTFLQSLVLKQGYLRRRRKTLLYSHNQSSHSEQYVMK